MEDETPKLLVEWLMGGLLGALMLFVGWSRSERNSRIDEVARKLNKTESKLDDLAVTVARDYLSKAETRLLIQDAIAPLSETLLRIEAKLDQLDNLYHGK